MEPRLAAVEGRLRPALNPRPTWEGPGGMCSGTTRRARGTSWDGTVTFRGSSPHARCDYLAPSAHVQRAGVRAMAGPGRARGDDHCERAADIGGMGRRERGTAWARSPRPPRTGTGRAAVAGDRVR